MHRALALAAALLAVCLAVVALRQGTEPQARKITASWARTPGVLNPEVRQETIGQTICVTGWTRTIRPPTSYTAELKVEQMREYSLGGRPADYQEDHLISLELGGHPTDRRNLWPEPRPHAEEVDRVENQLNDAVCSGRMTLAEAQLRESNLKHRSG
jgi:hypothetical protein